MSAMKLPKLVYYCQAWSVVREDRPIFDASTEACANGSQAARLRAVLMDLRATKCDENAADHNKKRWSGALVKTGIE
jgi:hypothetical protein